MTENDFFCIDTHLSVETLAALEHVTFRIQEVRYTAFTMFNIEIVGARHFSAEFFD